MTRRRFAALGEEVGDGEVLRAPLVPQHHVSDAPVPAHLEIRTGGVVDQETQQGVALIGVHATDMTGEPAVDVEVTAPGDRMYPDDGVFGARLEHRRRVGRGIARLGAKCLALAHVVPCSETIDAPLHGVGQLIVGRVHIGEDGVAAAGRAIDHAQHAERRWLGIPADVGVVLVLKRWMICVVDDVTGAWRLIRGARRWGACSNRRRPARNAGARRRPDLGRGRTTRGCRGAAGECGRPRRHRSLVDRPLRRWRRGLRRRDARWWR